ncbi:MAG TPA: Uma2 family endonuclease [Thermomicrobiales bacterium]|nr:Uma2 family endonuclease [Thermomicrobiales bacterium]
MATVQQRPKVAIQQRIVLHNISWATYECLLADHENTSVPRFTYDRGELEIMSPRSEHEDRTWATERIVETVIQEMGGEFRNTRSTTFRHRELERGFEADSSFYIQNEHIVRDSHELDLRSVPPPDLVIEIDVTNSSIDKLAVFAAVRVPEVWRHANGRYVFMHLDDAAYVDSNESHVLPGVRAADVSNLIAAIGTTGRSAWLRHVAEWARNLPRP